MLPTKSPTQLPTSIPVFPPTAAPSNPVYFKYLIAGFQTIAGGNGRSSSGDGGPASSASINTPTSLWLDSLNQIYIVDYSACVIRKVSADSIITTVGGNTCASMTPTFIPSVQPSTKSPTETPTSAPTNPFPLQYLFAKLDLYAGNGVAANTGDGGPATSAGLSRAAGLWMDSLNQMYIVDYFTCNVRLVSAAGIINTIGGSSTCPSSAMSTNPIAPFTSVTMFTPWGVWGDTTGIKGDKYGRLYIAESANNRIRMLIASDDEMKTYMIYTIVGTGASGTQTTPSLALSPIRSPNAVFITSDYHLYFSESSLRVRFTSPNGSLPTFQPSSPPSIFPSPSPTLIPTPSNSVSSQNPFYEMDLVVGSGSTPYNGDNLPAGTSTNVNSPAGIWVDSNGVVYFVDAQLCALRRINLNGTVSVVGGTISSCGWGNDGSGPFEQIKMSSTYGLTGDTTGLTLYVSDSTRLWKYNVSSGFTDRIAGKSRTFASAGDGGSAINATFNNIRGLWLTSSQNLYLTEISSNRVRVINMTTNIITTVAGSGSTRGDNGLATLAKLSAPFGVYVDTNGLLFIADSSNQRVRRVSLDGIITTIAGGGTETVSGWPATLIVLRAPRSIVGDSAGSLFVGEFGGYRVMHLDPLINGTNQVLNCSYIAYIVVGTGTVTSTYSFPQPALSPINSVFGLWLTPAYNLYVTLPGRVIVARANVTTKSPTSLPTTLAKTIMPTASPILSPTFTSTTSTPSSIPTINPTTLPTMTPTLCPTLSPTISPSKSPTIVPTLLPTFCPSLKPSRIPTSSPAPTLFVSYSPTFLSFTSTVTIRSPSNPISPRFQGSSILFGRILSSMTSSIETIDLTTSSSGSISASSAYILFGKSGSFPSSMDVSGTKDRLFYSKTASSTSYPSISFPSTLDSNGSVAPVISPTFRPSFIPTLRPTRIPTTVKPTVQPTMHPTHCPSVQPQNPSVIPSKAPSKTPTFSPTVIPTKAPTHRPSFNLMPTSTPSSVPTNSQSTPYATVTISSTGKYEGDEGKKQLFVITSPIGGTVTIEGKRGIKIYMVYPPTTSVTLVHSLSSSSSTVTKVVIGDFDVESDILDFSQIPSMQSMADLTYSTSPLTIRLMEDEVHVILSSHSAFDLVETNFVFATGESNQSENNVLTLVDSAITVPLAVLIGCLIGTYYLLHCYSKNKKVESKVKVAARVIAVNSVIEKGKEQGSVEKIKEEVIPELTAEDLEKQSPGLVRRHLERKRVLVDAVQPQPTHSQRLAPKGLVEQVHPPSNSSSGRSSSVFDSNGSTSFSRLPSFSFRASKEEDVSNEEQLEENESDRHSFRSFTLTSFASMRSRLVSFMSYDMSDEEEENNSESDVSDGSESDDYTGDELSFFSSY
eukprot:gene7894-8534_t